MKHKPYITAFVVAVTMLCAGSCSLIEKRLPDIQLSDVYDRKVSSANLTEGNKPVIISFYATWCDPCTKELNELASKYAEWQREYGAKIVIVSVDKYPAQVTPVVETMQRNGWDDFTLLFDTEGKLAQEMSVTTLPTVFFIDSSGKIVHSAEGFDPDKSIPRATEVLKKISAYNSEK